MRKQELQGALLKAQAGYLGFAFFAHVYQVVKYRTVSCSLGQCRRLRLSQSILHTDLFINVADGTAKHLLYFC